MHFNVQEIITGLMEKMGYWSYIPVWFVIFAESGLFFGFFLPGDSLLLTTGFLCYAHPETWNIAVMCFGGFVAAVLGDNVGYYTGRKYGRGLFEKEDSVIFKKKYLLAAQDFYEKKGPLAVVAARFVAIVRTFAPIVAGAAMMKYKTFITYNIVGGFLWVVGLNLLGYFLGETLEKAVGKDNVEKYLVLITLAVVLLSFIPSAIHLLKEMKKGEKSKH
jgi:membrane-associated protein